MSYIAKLSLPGFDVKSATPEQCAVHSEFPPLKAKIDQNPSNIFLLDVNFTSGVTQDTNHTVFSINHGYNYTPLILPNIVFNDGSMATDLVGIGSAFIGATLNISAEADSSEFRVVVYDNNNWINSSSTLQVSTYIFSENGN